MRSLLSTVLLLAVAGAVVFALTGAGGSGPAVLTVALKNKTTGELSQSLTRTISPGTQSGCAATLVGNITVSVTQDASPRVSINLA